MIDEIKYPVCPICDSDNTMNVECPKCGDCEFKKGIIGNLDFGMICDLCYGTGEQEFCNECGNQWSL